VGKFVNNNNKTTKMKKITEELPGSQRWVTKKIGDPKIKKSARKLIRKVNRKRHVVQVNNLYINVHVDISQIEKIEQLIMEYNQK
jgi:hypothetical protein